LTSREAAVARERPPKNGRDRLEEAMVLLINNQAAFVSSLRETDRLHAKLERETAERFARIEAQMAEIIRVLNEHNRILAEHTRILERLPDAVRDKIGFKPQQGAS
jgi:hypothetical protein